MLRVFLAASLAVFLSGCGCGRSTAQDDGGGGCTQDSECASGQRCVDRACVTEDAGFVPCTTNAECAPPLVCLRSQSVCVMNNDSDAGELLPDSGFVGTCLPGQVQSCGSSKLGACRLGTRDCEDGDAGWDWAACVGAVEPVMETCNGVDDDCDGLVDDGLGDVTCGVGACARTVSACLGGMAVTCTPGPSSAEVCDGVDNDCDGMTDEGLADLSCGVGACAVTATACLMGMPGTCTPADAGLEVCNNVDDDCDGTTDENLGQTTCGLGSCTRTVQNCAGGVPQPCTPGTPLGNELCNGVDDTCDGTIDEGCACTPAATQGCYTGMAGTADAGVCHPGTQTCSALGQWGGCVGQVTPTPETCDNADNDCNGAVDDNLGQTNCGTGVCARTAQNCVGGVAQTCTPGDAGVEVCNALDDDCDGLTDETLPPLSCGVGACAVTVASCVGGVTQTCTPGTPGTEVCNGLDDNCNGSTDETFPQSGMACSTGLPGPCGAGAYQCTSGSLGCQQTVTPVPEVCGNGLDENCNGITDDPVSCGCSMTIDRDLDGVNECLDCNDDDATIKPGAAEVCNGRDDDCDTQIDEGFDIDLDGFTTCGTVAGGGLDPLRADCNDNNAFVFPLKTTDCGATATPASPNGVDDNCNGYVDETCSCDTRDRDNDGVSECAGDCNDADGTIAPGRVEACDGKDNDCNKATVDNCGVSDPCGYKQGNTWYPWASGTDQCRADLICVSNVATGALTCGSFCNQTTGTGLNDSCASTEGCARNLLDGDNLHLCSVLTVGAGTTGAACTQDSQCRSGDCITDGTSYCTDRCTHESGCSANTSCSIERQQLTSGPFIIGSYYYGFCRADAQLPGTRTTGQSCDGGTSCHNGQYSCVNGTCAEPCCENADCAGGSSCTINGPRVATGYSIGGEALHSIVPVCLPSAATRVTGQACTTSAQCRSGICDAARGVCADVCCNDVSCPNGTSCELLTLGYADGGVVSARLCVTSPPPARINQR